MRLGIDLMGSDTSPLELFLPILKITSTLSDHQYLIVFVTPAIFEKIHSLYRSFFDSPLSKKIIFSIADDEIYMGDEPLFAIRQKKKSSLVLGLKSLKKKQIDGFITAGNTGALIAGATLWIPLLPGLSRPALLALLPTKSNKKIAVLDVGGNVYCKSVNLLQFAFLGAVYQKCFQNISKPTVCLLNIGIESKKGTTEIQQAFNKLANLQSNNEPNLPFKFLGNMEGKEMFEGKADVIVTDGFSGNVLLKTSEGISAFIGQYLQEHIEEIPEKFLHNFRRQFSYEEAGGAVLCGLESLVIKCHGHSSPQAFGKAIENAITAIEKDAVGSLKKEYEFINPQKYLERVF
ncbi:Phosphate acyltransferase [Candidatus Rubidus massiliensis]|nr:Phosphate acyltransferase [Candidatus Rubidus massiliensis]